MLRAIFGEKAREVKDTSLRVPHGERGKVVDVRVFTRDGHDELPAGVNELVRVSIAQKRKICRGRQDGRSAREQGRGLADRSRVRTCRSCDDGTPVQIILNPIGVPSRMNVGQILETHLGWAAEALGFKVATPVFDGASEEEIVAELDRGEPATDGKARLRDGRTGELFRPGGDRRQHLHVEARPPGGRQDPRPVDRALLAWSRSSRWAARPSSAASALARWRCGRSKPTARRTSSRRCSRSSPTTSIGRVKTYEAIVKGENIMEPGVPESFKVLVKELQSLGLAVEVLNEDEERIPVRRRTSPRTDSCRNSDINSRGFEHGDELGI